jgi:hypothetical protein
VPFSDAPKRALSIWCHLGGRQVVITRAVSGSRRRRRRLVRRRLVVYYSLVVGIISGIFLNTVGLRFTHATTETLLKIWCFNLLVFKSTSQWQYNSQSAVSTIIYFLNIKLVEFLFIDIYKLFY